MMEVKARERFSEVLAVVLGIALIGFLLYLVVSQHVVTPKVPPINVSSNGPAIAVANKSNGAVKSSPSHSTAAASTAPPTTAVAANDPKISSATTSAGQKYRNGTSRLNTSGRALLSTTASLTCDTPLRPISATLSGVEKGLQSVLPLTKAVTATISCSS